MYIFGDLWFLSTGLAFPTSTPRLFSQAFVAFLSAGAIAGIAAASGTGMKILLLPLMEEILKPNGICDL